MKVQILNASVSFFEQTFRRPLQISSGVITSITEARVSVRVSVAGKEAEGWGSIYLSDLWAWPGAHPDHAAKDAAMRALCREIAGSLPALCGNQPEHPLELGLQLHHSISSDAVVPEMPLLAKAVCVSPFDAAIHDATGQALGLSAFDFYTSDAAIPSTDDLFPGTGTVAAIRSLLRKPSSSLRAWWLVSAKDNLENDVHPYVAANGINSFKIKILAKDNQTDAERTSEVYQAAVRWGLDPILSVDSNEGNPSAESVVDYLDRLRVLDSAAYDALSYLEQPTARDIIAHPQDWHVVGIRKPVLLDEGLVSLELLPEAERQGWSGLALKTCKGHSFALVAAAWAHQRGMLIAQQDLTNPGYSGIHSFLFASHISTINGVELNSPQYTPSANAPWLPQLAGLFTPDRGVHTMDISHLIGLGGTQYMK